MTSFDDVHPWLQKSSKKRFRKIQKDSENKLERKRMRKRERRMDRHIHNAHTPAKQRRDLVRRLHALAPLLVLACRQRGRQLVREGRAAARAEVGS